MQQSFIAAKNNVGMHNNLAMKMLGRIRSIVNAQ